ncbi:MAG: protein NO VEIN domain-containing protein [Alkaliphilus sp.]
MYKIDEQYYFRLHHVRPRFKSDIENVLMYVSTAISNLSKMDEYEFADQLNSALYLFPGNQGKKIKTINNCRTEISALFGFYITDNGYTIPGLRAKELAESEDLVEMFKIFLYNFQYPGGHIKPHEIFKQIEAGVNFKPAQYLLKLLRYAEECEGKRTYITKPEFVHCVMNDLRCTRDNQDISTTWENIKTNRDNHIEYDAKGDVIRYGGDIMDYMEIANLLVTYDSRHFYVNKLEEEAVLLLINSSEWFSNYDSMTRTRTADLESIKDSQVEWLNYVNRNMDDTDLSTDILAFISEDQDEYEALKLASYDLLEKKISDSENITTKDIGDLGEGLVHGHECERIKIGGRKDLLHLIKRIPTQFAVGYDIQSVELDTRKRYIEVKTTISSKPLHFNKVHLTPNEWSTASSLNDRYFIYRLMISKKERKLFLIQDPVGMYKKDLIQMIPINGAEISFDTKNSGRFEELLVWVS